MKSILIPMMSSGLRQTANLALKADHPPSGRLILAKRIPSILPTINLLNQLHNNDFFLSVRTEVPHMAV